MTDSTAIRFDGQVAVVTGAGNGLGREHALLLAARGAKVVVNDYGPTLHGGGSSEGPADQVVAEIRATGGEAVANYHGVHTVAGAEAIIQTAIDSFGAIDILVCNAGILKNEPFGEQTDENWQRHLAVHLDGTMFTARASWRHMQKANYGRLIFTSSGGGLHGKAGLTAYGAAKAGIYGLMRCLAQEAGEQDIRVNGVLPAAVTRMLSDEVREQMGSIADPAFVSPLVAYLASRECADNGRIYSAGAGYFARERVVMGTGYRFGRDNPITPEQVAGHWAEINDMSEMVGFDEATECGARILGGS